MNYRTILAELMRSIDTFGKRPDDGNRRAIEAQLRDALDEAAAQSEQVAPPVALQSVELSRDTQGMCVVKVNGREAIRDNGDVISHYATLDWFAQPAPAAQSEPLTAEQRREIEEAMPKVGESESVWTSIRASTLRALVVRAKPGADHE